MSKQSKEVGSSLRPFRTILVLLLLAVVLVTAWCLSPIPTLLARQTAMRHMREFTSGQVSGVEIVSEQWGNLGLVRYRTGFNIQCRTEDGAYALEIVSGYLPVKVMQAIQVAKG